MRRILLVLLMAAVMAAVISLSAASAFAANPFVNQGCKAGDTVVDANRGGLEKSFDRNGDDIVCASSSTPLNFYDNTVAKGRS